jgi:hypothetical protein
MLTEDDYIDIDPPATDPDSMDGIIEEICAAERAGDVPRREVAEARLKAMHAENQAACRERMAGYPAEAHAWTEIS